MFNQPLKVKISTSFPQWPLQNQLPKKSLQLGNITFVIDQPDPLCDFWIVFDDLTKPEKGYCAAENVLFVTGEPPSIRSYTSKFLKQFASVLTCHPHLPHPHIIHGQQGHPWHVGMDYDTVTKNLILPKTKTLSIITSNKVFTAGHRSRFDFAHRLKKEFGNQVELFGRGVQTFSTKWDVLAPFKYTISIENYCLNDWITEKLPDSWLAESYPIYYGAPNVFDYYPKDSLTPIDIHQPDQAILTIAALLINTDHYQAKLPAIREAKRRYLDKYSFFPLLGKHAQELFKPHATKRYLTLKPMRTLPEGWLEHKLNILKTHLATK